MINSSWDIPIFKKHRVAKGGVVLGKGPAIGTPFHQSVTISIAASASGASETIYTVTPPRLFLLSTLIVGTLPSGVTLSSLEADGTLVAGANGLPAGTLDFLTLFGDFIPSIEDLTVLATNTNASSENVTIDLYGWLYPAYETVNVKVGG